MIIADLHIHSKYSRATSKNLDIENLEKWAKIKGVNLLGTGDFTHPSWLKELKEKLTDNGEGILLTKNNFPFLLQTEISLIYTQDGKGRRVHHIILAPNLDIVEQIREYLLKKGRIDYDGRPIFKIPTNEFVYELKKISDKIEIIPAHIWTPWFGMLGSKSGFDSIKDCFKDQVNKVHAIETGLSSDPAMNWRLSQLDKFSIVSFSDSHSFWPWRLAREATIFNVKLSYDNIIKALRTKEGLVETIEVDPSYGKYHFTGHRNCNVILSPKEAIKLNNICPKCGNELTIGVLQRVEQLADREEGYKPSNAIPFKSLIPFSEILAFSLNSSPFTQKVWTDYYRLVNENRSEYDVLLNFDFNELKKITNEKIANLILQNRNQRFNIKPGYDGVYGKLLLEENKNQMSLGEF